MDDYNIDWIRDVILQQTSKLPADLRQAEIANIEKYFQEKRRTHLLELEMKRKEDNVKFYGDLLDNTIKVFVAALCLGLGYSASRANNVEMSASLGDSNFDIKWNSKA